MVRVQDSIKYPKISLSAFNMFYKIVYKHKEDSCNTKKLVQELNTKFRTSDCIFGALYANKSRHITQSVL